MVLIVDDEPLVARAVARLLRQAGMSTLIASGPSDALEHARHTRFDVIVSDVRMPEMDGPELIRQLRVFDYDVPVILMTGSPSLQTAQAAVEVGAYRYLTKPVDPTKLRETVTHAGFLHRMQRIQREAAAIYGEGGVSPTDCVGLELALDHALEHAWIAYQPIVDARDGTLFGYEALLRSRTQALPHVGAVLSAAERLGRIHEVGRKVRRLAIEPLRGRDDVRLFVNLHPDDLADPWLVGDESPLRELVHRPVLEITERARLQQTHRVRAVLDALRVQGYPLAIDDLGSGYAGLNSFADLDVEFVKLDMALVRGVDASRRKARLIEMVVGLCHDLEVRVVAEGIETLAERHACQALGVDLLQGYLIARPGPAFPDVVWED